MYLYGGLPKAVAVLILLLFSLYLGLYHALFAWLTGILSRTRLGLAGALALTPFVWVAVELARTRVTGFPWDLLGNTQIDNRLLMQIPPLAGVLGVSFLVASVNAACASLWISVDRRRWLVLGAAAASFAIIESKGFPPDRRKDALDEAQTAVMLQENLSVGAAARGTERLGQREMLDRFNDLTAHSKNANGQQARPTVIVWPEAPAGFQSNEADVVISLQHLAQSVGAPLIVGLLGVDLDRRSPIGYYLYDSAAVLNRTGALLGRYDKIHLVPWGEYVPFKSFFRFADKLTAGSGNMDPGHSRSVFTMDGHRYGIFICYESIFGDEVRRFVENGAEVLVNISDDGWYGDSGAPWQHLNMARMRAVENHRWVLRDTNTGETTVIDPWGHFTMTERHVQAAYALPFGFSQVVTFYTAHGDWFAYLCSVITVAALLGTSLSRPRPHELR
jgi:apolipoprotein N-acyltransferase